MSIIYDELLALSFEDRIAQTVMALLYSASHIEITSRMPYTEKELKNGVPKATAIRNRVDKLKTTHDAAVDAALQPLKARDIPTGELQATPRILIRTDEQPSEIDNDTTAIAIVGDSLYIACNFKRRYIVGTGENKDDPKSCQPKLSPKSFDYLSFGVFPDTSIILLVNVLRAELADVATHGGPADKARATAIRYIRIIGPSVNPTSAETNAQAHAEMQIVNYCLPKVIDLPGARLDIGVSRACCPGCARYLRGARLGFTREHNREPQNWLHPARFSTKLLHVIAV